MSYRISVLSGAGISTSAGIPDFRGPKGIWTLHPEQMNVYDLDLFIHDKEARMYSWRWQKESPVWNAHPGKAHHALYELEKYGNLGVIATQNFDGLHEKAGNSPENIINLHGTISTSHCMDCDRAFDTKLIMDDLDNHPDPHCEVCGGIIKTDVTYFGQALPEGAYYRAERGIEQSDELWVIGSTLEVYPAALLVPFAARENIPITIFNAEATQYDYLAREIIRDDISRSIPRAVNKILQS